MRPHQTQHLPAGCCMQGLQRVKPCLVHASCSNLGAELIRQITGAPGTRSAAGQIPAQAPGSHKCPTAERTKTNGMQGLTICTCQSLEISR